MGVPLDIDCPDPALEVALSVWVERGATGVGLHVSGIGVIRAVARLTAGVVIVGVPVLASWEAFVALTVVAPIRDLRVIIGSILTLVRRG